MRHILRGTAAAALATLALDVSALNVDFIDFTHGRPRSFFDDADAWVRVDLTEPFCPETRTALIDAGRPVFGSHLAERGVFLCAEGPRFETPAESCAETNHRDEPCPCGVRPNGDLVDLSHQLSRPR